MTVWRSVQKVGRKKDFDALLKGKLQPGIQSLPRELSLPKDGVLRIKPLLEVKGGQVFNMGQARTRKRGIEHLKEILQQQGHLERLAILHTNAEADALAFIKDLDREIPANPLIVNVTTIIGTHVGPEGLGFAAVLR